jgi:CubicO group peptidase (beta-lactamase class C family)
VSKTPAPWAHRLSRRALLGTGASTVLGATALGMLPGATHAASRRTPATAQAVGPGAQDADALFRALDAKIEAAMAEYHIPGVAVGVYYRGQEYVRGYGVTNVDYPQPVDGDTLFRIASTTKTFTGTTVMRLVEQGLLDLNAPVRTYLPDFRVADELASERVTLRECLNHSVGWEGDYSLETAGRGADALTRYVAGMADLPQLTPPGTQFAYSNPALAVAGRVIEVVTGQSYEDAVRELLIDPLGLDHTRFFTDEVAGYPMAGSHKVEDDKAVFGPDLWPFPRSGHAYGGLISSARDQVRYARFHLGDGRAPDGTPLLTPASLVAMRSNPGPGGTLGFELDGLGVTFQLRRTAEGIRVAGHGGDWPGQHSNFLFVPERDFALTLLTNSTSGARLVTELFLDDWALQRFAGLHNPPAAPARLSPARLAEYEGDYGFRALQEGERIELITTLRGSDGTLRGQFELLGPGTELQLEFYRGEYALVVSDLFQPLGSARANFVRGPDGRVAWLSFGGRLFAYKR